MISLRDISIKYKVLIGILIVIFISVLSTTVILSYTMINSIKSSYHKEVQSIAKTLALGIEIGLKSGDLEAVQKAMNYAKSDKRVAFISIMSEGKSFSSYPDKFEYKDELSNVDSLLIKKEKISSEMLKDAAVIIGISTSDLNEQTSRTYWLSLIIFLSNLLVGFFLSLIIARIITKPIIFALSISDKISSGDIKGALASLNNSSS